MGGDKVEVYYKEISLKARKYWKDENGKRHQKTKTFSQTINPFNKNTDGTIKTESEIYEELDKQRTGWLHNENIS